MRIESIERPEDGLVKIVKGLVTTHGNQTPDARGGFQIDVEPVFVS